MGVLIADIIRHAMKTDISFVNSGTVRSDEIHGPGPITMRDLMKILPLPDTLVAVEMSGADFHLALENAVAAWPKLEGRFVQVSQVLEFYKSVDRRGSCLESVPSSVCCRLFFLRGRGGKEGKSVDATTDKEYIDLLPRGLGFFSVFDRPYFVAGTFIGQIVWCLSQMVPDNVTLV